MQNPIPSGQDVPAPVSRRFKVRVWDKAARRMINHDQGYQGHYILTLDGNFQNLQNGVGGSEVVVMLSTGRHDRVGKNIFEKDILQTTAGQKCICEYVPATASYCLFPLAGSTTPPSLSSGAELEVIGNIFEGTVPAAA